MKKIVFPLVGMLILALSGCNKEGSNIDYYEGPAIVDYQGGMMVLKTYLFSTAVAVTEKADVPIYPGDYIYAVFNVDYDNQPTEGVLAATNFNYIKIKGVYLQATPKGESPTGDYNTKISDFGISCGIDKVLFLMTAHTSKFRDFDYEVTYDPETLTDTPTLYVRAQETGSGDETSKSITNIFGVNMASFLASAPKDAQDRVKFNIKFKTGVDDDGADVYTDYAKNPVVW